MSQPKIKSSVKSVVLYGGNMVTIKIINTAVVVAAITFTLNVAHAAAQSELSKKFGIAVNNDTNKNTNNNNVNNHHNGSYSSNHYWDHDSTNHDRNYYNNHNKNNAPVIIINNNHNRRPPVNYVNQYYYNPYYNSNYYNPYYNSYNNDLAWGLGAAIVGGFIAESFEDRRYQAIHNNNYFNGNSWVRSKGYRYLNNEILIINTDQELFTLNEINFLTSNHIRTSIITSNYWIREHRTQFDMLTDRTDIFDISIR